MWKRLVQVAALVAADVVFVSATTASSQEVRWDLSNEYQQSSLMGQGDIYFADKIKELTNGRIIVTNHFGSALGFGSKDVLDAVGRGVVPLGDASVVPWGGIEPIFLLSGLPLLATTTDEALKLFEIARPSYEQVLLKHNQYLLFSTPWPPSGIWSKAPIENVASLSGVKIRTYDPVSTKIFSSVGASPQQLPWADVVPLLATNGIEAVLTSADGGASQNFWELVSHFTDINYAIPLNMATINKDVFDALSEADKKAVREAASATQEHQWESLRGRVAENYTEMRAHGVSIVSAPEDLRNALASASEPMVQDWAKAFGAEGQSIIDSFKRAAP